MREVVCAIDNSLPPIFVLEYALCIGALTVVLLHLLSSPCSACNMGTEQCGQTSDNLCALQAHVPNSQFWTGLILIVTFAVDHRSAVLQSVANRINQYLELDGQLETHINAYFCDSSAKVRALPTMRYILIDVNTFHINRTSSHTLKMKAILSHEILTPCFCFRFLEPCGKRRSP